MNNKKVLIGIIIAIVIVTIIGGTLAYWNWQTTNVQKTNVTFTIGSNFSCGADGGGNIMGDKKLAPAECTDTDYAVQRTITTYINNSSADPVYMDMWLNVNSIGTYLSQTSNFKYALTTSSNSCTTGESYRKVHSKVNLLMTKYNCCLEQLQQVHIIYIFG